jgi:hypothetical protein
MRAVKSVVVYPVGSYARIYQMYYDPSIRILAGVRENLYVDSNLLSYWR